MYIPTPRQVEAHCAVERHLGFGGAMGGGKTRFLCEMAKLLSIKFPGNFGLLARQSGPALKMSTQEVFFSEVLQPGGAEWKTLKCVFNKSEGLLEFRCFNPPSRIWFTGLDSDNTERLKSLNLGWFGIDEATEVSESIYLMLCTRLRRKGIPSEYRKAMVSANPEAGWVKRRFIDQKLKDHKFVFSNFKDNPHLPADYASLFDTMPLAWREKYLHGDWGAVSGLIFKEFVPEIHIIPNQEVPPEWIHFRALDHGQQNPAACLGFAYGYGDKVTMQGYLGDRVELLKPEYDEYPIIICYRLYYGTGLVSQHRTKIAKAFSDIENYGPTFGDPSMWAKNREKLQSDGQATDYSIAQEYMDAPDPLLNLVRANNRVVPGINRVATLLSTHHLFFMDHPSMDPLIGLTGEIRSYSWKQPKTDDMDWPETPIKSNDHACDALRYGAMSLPPMRIPQPKLIPHSSFAAARMRAMAAKKGTRQLTIDKGKVVSA